MRHPFFYLLFIVSMLAAVPLGYAQEAAGTAAEVTPELPRNDQVIEFDPMKLRVIPSHTYVIPVKATGCPFIKKDSFELDGSRIGEQFVTWTEETTGKRVEGQREMLITKTCIVKIELTVHGSLKGTHRLIYSPTGDIVATIKVSRDRTNGIIDLRK